MQGVFSKPSASGSTEHSQDAARTTEMPFGGAFGKQNANSSGNPKPIPLLGNVVVPGFLPPPKTRSVSQFSIPLFQVYTTVEKMADERDVVHHFQNISFREPYMDYSLEELRLADYLSLKPSAPSSGDTPANTPSSEQSKPSATFGNSRVDASGKDTGEDHSSVKARSESISAWERQMETVMQRSPTASSFASETTTRHNASDLPSFLKISSVDGEDFGTSDASSGAFPTPSSTTPASSGTTSRGPGTSSIMASSANQTPSGNNGGTSGASPNAMSGANGPAMTFSERVSRKYAITKGATSPDGKAASDSIPSTSHQPSRSGNSNAGNKASNSKSSSPDSVSSITANVGGASSKRGERRKKFEKVVEDGKVVLKLNED
ncbi:uncharacterized protein BKA78DRAFT_26783 [Phyllosticta capitalensis]|uniref:uncharacterized protein n=1 Tax=Phyllosticta capitalensis TaxID=121624 RepID=UPI00312ECAD0